MLYHPFPHRQAENDVQNRPASPSQQLVPPQLQREEDEKKYWATINHGVTQGSEEEILL